MTQEMIQRWSSRKFWTMVVASVVFTGLLIAGIIDGALYATLILPTIGSYFASNVTASIWGKR